MFAGIPTPLSNSPPPLLPSYIIKFLDYLGSLLLFLTNNLSLLLFLAKNIASRLHALVLPHVRVEGEQAPLCDYHHGSHRRREGAMLSPSSLTAETPQQVTTKQPRTRLFLSSCPSSSTSDSIVLFMILSTEHLHVHVRLLEYHDAELVLALLILSPSLITHLLFSSIILRGHHQ